MRHAAASALRLGLFAVTATGLLAIASGARAEYYCSPGFEPVAGGRCVATLSRSEVDLFLNDPVYEEAPRPLHRVRHHRRHGLRLRY